LEYIPYLMADLPSLTRRGVLKTVGTVALGASQLDAVGATADTAGSAQRGARVETTRTTQDAEDVTEEVTVSVDRESDTIRYAFEYQIPGDSAFETTEIDNFAVQFGTLGFLPFREATESQNFDRETVTDGSDYFVWTGAGTPRLVFEDDLTAESFEEIGYYTDTELFVGAIPSRDARRGLSGSDSDSSYTLEGAGFVNEDLLYVGPHASERRVVDGTELAVVVPESVEATVDIQRTLDLLAEWQRLLGGLRLVHQSTACMVLPSQQMAVAGRAIGGSFYLSSEAWGLDSIENTVSHEFVHTVFGTFGTGKMYWLKEAVAEYYGYLLALNTGLGDFDEFLDALEVDLFLQDAVLTDTEKRIQDSADYSKGAHVLAALDAEIRRRSDGAQSLLSIFEYALDSPLWLSRYNTFEGVAQRMAAFSEDFPQWLDQYVDGEDYPEIPDQRDRYTFRGRGKPNEIQASVVTLERDEPFEITTDIESLRATTETVPVELFLSSSSPYYQKVAHKDVELGADETETVRFTEADVGDIEGDQYNLILRAGGNEVSTRLSVAAPPDFRVNELDPGRRSLPADDSLSVAIDIRNAGDEAGTTTLELLLVADGTEQVLTTQTVDIDALTTETVSVEGIDFGDTAVDPGEYTLVARTEDNERAQSLVVEDPTGGDQNDTQRTESSSDGSGPGFGIASTVTGVGGLAYLFGRRLGPDETDEESG
jgi:hypothetical protein